MEIFGQILEKIWVTEWAQSGHPKFFERRPFNYLLQKLQILQKLRRNARFPIYRKALHEFWVQ